MQGANHFEQEEAAFRKQLAQLCQLSDLSLEENRAGLLAYPQKSRLLRTAIAPFLKSLLALVALAGSAAIAARVEPPTRITALTIAGAVGLSALFFVSLAYSIKFLLECGRAWNLLRDLSEGRVTSIRGHLAARHSRDVADINAAVSESLRFSNEGSAIVLRSYLTNQEGPTLAKMYSLVVNLECFDASEDAYDAMSDRDSQPHCLYVTPRSRYLVALDSAVRSQNSFELRSTASHW